MPDIEAHLDSSLYKFDVYVQLKSRLIKFPPMTGADHDNNNKMKNVYFRKCVNFPHEIILNDEKTPFAV